MPARTDEAFVLTRYPYRERDLVVVLLARSTGQLRVLARRARGARSPQATALEPLALVRISYFERAQRELATLDEAVPVRSAFELREPLACGGAGGAELALVFCPPGQAAEQAFRLVDHRVAALLAGCDPLAVAAYAQLWFVKLAGVFPELDVCVTCSEALTAGGRAYDAGDGGFLCPTHARGRTVERLAPAAVEWLRRALRGPVAEVGGPAPAAALGWLVALQQRFTEREIAGVAKLPGRGERVERTPRCPWFLLPDPDPGPRSRSLFLRGDGLRPYAITPASPSSWMRRNSSRTAMPALTAAGSTSTTWQVTRGPSASSTTARAYGTSCLWLDGPTWMTVQVTTFPSGRSVTVECLVLRHFGHTTRGGNATVPQPSQRAASRR
jgi:DNA repair protein RecO